MTTHTETLATIDEILVERLIADQFPQWSHLAVTKVEPGGWDNRTFRLGDDMLVRLPSAERYVAQVAKEQAWLPFLAQHLPLAIPVPIAAGKPASQYPWPWSVYKWIKGTVASQATAVDGSVLARQLGGFLKALHLVPVEGGPLPGRHNFFRGSNPRVYNAETATALRILKDVIDAEACRKIWSTASTSDWHGLPVWIHGDVALGNLLLTDGNLSAVIDFGSSAVGDPACDLVMAWTSFNCAEREVFRKSIELDPPTWQRARGWALWKALIVAGAKDSHKSAVADAMRVLNVLIAEYRAGIDS